MSAQILIKNARLVKAKDPTKWYIEYYLFDEDAQKLTRQRFYKFNTITDLKKRERYAQEKVQKINRLQQKGYQFNPAEIMDFQVKTPVLDERDFFELLENAVALRAPIVAKKTQASYRQAVRDLKEFFRIKDWNFKNPDRVSSSHFISYSDYLLIEKKLSAKTRNNYFSYLSALIQVMVERSQMAENPLENIKCLPVVVSHKNFAYQDYQIPLVKQAYLNILEDLWLYAQFVYYCFMRPAEIAKMKVGDIDIKKKKIFIPAHNTKIKRSDYVTIPDVFLKTVEKRIKREPSTYFVFSKSNSPGTEKIADNKMTKLSRKALSTINFESKFTLYSWKHTGVVAAHNAGINIKHIQMQCRHRSLDDTNTYLKSLGLTENTEISIKMPSV